MKSSYFWVSVVLMDLSSCTIAGEELEMLLLPDAGGWGFCEQDVFFFHVWANWIKVVDQTFESVKLGFRNLLFVS